jgi:hypothetical protein
MANTLGLDDDLDSVEVVISLEKAFAVNISDDEASSCNTVGDIYDLLYSRFSTQIGAPGSCMTSMAFYRLRRSLRRLHPGVEFRPDTPLALCAGRNARAFLDRLRSDSGLQLPRAQGRWLSWAGWLLMIVAVLGIALVAVIKGPHIFYVAGIMLIGLSVGATTLDPGALPRDCKTLGGLAAKVSALNYGALAQSGGAVWRTFCRVSASFQSLTCAAIR